ncbi:MAG TPA: hypothetical protein PKA03_09550 [Tabrizicola sp.]|nr:hypothetical protein [Tabrizicola sp.]
METSYWYAIATLVAIVLGPIVAVIVTRVLDGKSERRRRKIDVFRNLMQTRGIRLDPVHVAALNILEIEFYNEPEVRRAYADYIAHLSAPMPNVSEQDRFFEQRSDLFMSLLHKMGDALKFRFDKRDLERLSYVPQGWDTDHSLQRKNAALLSQILSGERAIPVTNIISGPSPFPDPPQVEGPK